MGIARPNFGDVAPFVLYDPTSSNSFPVSAGNPDLKPTHAQNADLLIERYLKPLGLIQFGGFYKYLTDPIYTTSMTRTVAPYVGFGEFIPVNGPRAHVSGIEMSWQQQLRVSSWCAERDRRESKLQLYYVSRIFSDRFRKKRSSLAHSTSSE